MKLNSGDWIELSVYAVVGFFALIVFVIAVLMSDDCAKNNGVMIKDYFGNVVCVKKGD